MPDLIVAVDIGTTSTKAVVFDAQGAAHGAGDQGYPLLEPKPGWAVQDPLQVVAAALEAARASLSGNADVAGLAFSSAMHSLVGLDDHDRPLTELLTWGDDRAAEQAERLRAEHPKLHASTGTPLHPMAPLPKLMWFRENEPELFGRVRRWVGIKELVVHRLTAEWVIDVSCASGTGLMSLDTLDWDPVALAIAGVERDQLSRVVPCEETLSLESGELGLARRTPLVIGGAINNGGAVLAWTGEALAPELGPHPEQELLRLAAAVPAGSEGLIMLPYLLSERAPHWDTVARGAYIGLRYFHRRGHLVRAAIEGVCQQLALVLASMRDAGHEVREIRATGGFARSELWRQMLSDVLGMPIGFPAAAQGSALGAALLGMSALGLADSISHASDLVRIDEVRHPDPDRAATYAALLPLFADLYEDLVPAFRTLAHSERDYGR